jgi:predicted dienelactone hydrolase
MNIILEALIVALLIWMMFRSQKQQQQIYLLFIFLALIGLHLSIGLIRWQRIPLYLSIVSFLFVQANGYLNKKGVKGILLSLLILSVIANQVFPIYPMPKPTGSLLVGTQSIILTDSSRIDLYHPNGQPRQFKIQLWYPTDNIEGLSRALWIEDGVEMKRALALDMGLPSFVFDPLATYMSNSYADAPLSSTQSTYEVVIISHGWSSLRTLHTDLAEELASQGMVVIAIEHTYGSLATRFSDNDIQYLNRDALPRRAITPDYLTYANRLLNTFAEDIITTIDWLDKMTTTQGHWLYQQLDPTSITLIGHSTGGGAAVKAGMVDERVAKVIGFDAWVEPLIEAEIQNGSITPSFFIRSQAWEVGENNSALLPLVAASPNSTLYQLAGTTHYDFAMVYMFSPLSPLLGVTGSLNRVWLNNFLVESTLSFINNPDASQFINQVPELELIQ